MQNLLASTLLAELPISPTKLLIFAFIAIVAFVFILIIATFASIWIRALFSGAPVKFTDLIALRLRRVPVGMIVDTRITAVKSGLPLTIDDLSTHYLAGGNVEMVVLALIAAKKAGIHLDFDRGCAIDLATKGTGKTVLEAVKTSVNPKVIDCPNPVSGKNTIDGVAKDGIVIHARARVTVRTNLDRFVGGATEETIIARVGEGIVTTIGTANSYKDVLENPDRISKTVLDKALDSHTAFEILSIDIADVYVGENVGEVAGRTSRGEQTHRASAGRSAPRRRRSDRAGNDCARFRNARARRRGRGAGADGHGRGIPFRQSGHHGLLSDEERAGRYLHARIDRWNGQAAG